MTPEPTYYELLGIEPNATPAQIKSAFRQQVKRFHPDQGGNPALFRLIEEAYETLISPTTRATYDAGHYQRGQHTRPRGNRMDDRASWGEPTEAWEGSGWDQSSWAGEPAAAGVNREPSLADENTDEAGAASHVRWTGWATLTTWVIVVLVMAALILPGLTSGGLVTALLTFVLIWFFGSIVLRIGGWIMMIQAFIAFKWNGLAGIDAFRQGLFGFLLWLGGQWFYTFRKGRWHSLIAHGLLTRLPTFLRPDRRWQRA